MFYLKEFPNQEIHDKYANKYKEYNMEKFLSCAYLLRAGSETLKAFESFLSQHNFTQAKFLTLMILMRDPDKPLNPSEIARIMGVKKPTITGIIDGLLKEEFITRNASSTDRRKYKIKISNKGKERIEKITPDYFKYMSDLMAVFSKEESMTLQNLLVKLLSNIE